MKSRVVSFILLLSSAVVFTACDNNGKARENHNHEKASHHEGTEHGYGDQAPDTTTHYPQEKHLANIKQLTFGGDNAEAYFSFDDSMITFQAKNPEWNAPCDQIYYFTFTDGNMESGIPPLISEGLGRTTCSFFMPGNETILYASTRSGGDACPPDPQKREDGKYVWPIYSDFDIYVADLKGNVVDTLVSGPGYDAEATVSRQGDKIVFTSDRSGDLELYTCDIDGSNQKQITFDLGYDGGAFFSPDGKKLVFRSSRPKTEAEIKEYKDLLKQGLVKPTNMEIYTCNVDGSDLKRITNLGKANWAPYYHPSGEKIIFSSNHAGARGFEFNLYMINADGTGEAERITYDHIFDAFPMFSYDGKKLIFSSNRNNGGTTNTNLFIADWVD
jgi:Tol biopolymer transport system component